MNKRMVYLTIVVLLGAAGTFAWNLTARAAYESAEYSVMQAEGPFEVREYPDLMLASTETNVQSQGGDGSFMRLFRYISGANEAEQKVAMTTPVFMQESAEGTSGSMGFVMPKQVAIKGVPAPTGVNVKIRRREGGKFAVIRFAGRVDARSAEDAERRLRAWAEKKGLRVGGEAELAGYDPPWTPGPLRRNEVLIRLLSDGPT